MFDTPHIKGPDGFDHEADILITSMLGYCGCYMPYLLEAEFRAAIRDFKPNERGTTRAHLMLDDNDPQFLVRYFVIAALDKGGLCEHGGSLGYVWLTETGHWVADTLEL